MEEKKINWVIEKLLKDLKQSKYNLHKIGFDKLSITKNVEQLITQIELDYLDTN